jgi:hypothetical protein
MNCKLELNRKYVERLLPKIYWLGGDGSSADMVDGKQSNSPKIKMPPHPHNSCG